MKMKKSAGMFLAAAVTAMIGVGGIAAPANAATLDDPNAQAMLSMVNQHRANNGLNPVVWNQSIADVAQYWSPIAAQDLAEDGVLDNPHNDNYFGMYPSGATSGSENVAWGQSIEGVFNQWVNSPAHNANMLNPNTNTFGFGYVVGHDPAYPGMIMATQNFATYPNVETVEPPTLVAHPSADTVLAGETVTLYGTLTNATSPVSVWVDESYVMNDWSNQNSNQNHLLTPDANGNFQIIITVPENARTGTINAGFRHGSLSANTTVNVIEAPVPVEPSPEVPAPEVPVPVEPTPEVPTPEVPAPEVPTPSVPAPEVPTPSVPAPEVPTPSVPAPEVPTPEVPTPSVPAPEVPTPEVPTPSVPVNPTPEVPEVPAEVINPVKNETPVLETIDNGVLENVDNVLGGSVVLDETNRGSFEMVTSADGKMLTVTGLTPGVTYEIWLHSNPLFAGEYVADADGAVSVSIPDDLENGDHKAVIYVDGELIGWQDFSKGELAYTGTNGTQMATLGFAGLILLAGGALTAVGRRGFSKN